MSSIDGLPPLRDVIARHRLSAKKSLGQNFLLDLNLTAKIARAAGPPDGQTIVEIGPGPGGLTRGLLMEGARRVIVVERDERVLPVLDEISAHYPGRLEIISGDALKVNWQKVVAGPARIVANLPYNISTALLTGWLTGDAWPPWFSSLTLMFQKEVAERITAEPGSKVYGRLSVISQWRATAKRLFDVPPSAFTPAPKVTSSIVRITPREPVLACDVKKLERVTKAAFGQRRKMLRASLRSVFANPQAVLELAGIDPKLRAEQIKVEDFCRLACHDRR